MMNEKRVSFIDHEDDDSDDVYIAPIRKKRNKKQSWFKWFIEKFNCCVH